MKKYKLLKDLPWIKAWWIITWSAVWEKYYDVWEFVMKEEMLERNNDFFEPIEEKKTFDVLTTEDDTYFIGYNWKIYSAKFSYDCCRSETFLTEKEAEDEHKRREWANRKDKFIPKEGEKYFYPYANGSLAHTFYYSGQTWDILRANSWLCFRTEEECQDAIDNNDIIRLFYTIR